ncbi:unnamed protein product [Closterium sp. Yama58-4]|nr:unnamed protein product [Closterium sp. Yama58-4]
MRVFTTETGHSAAAASDRETTAAINSPNKLRLFHMDAQRSRERFARLLAGDADGAQQLGAQLQGASLESSRDGNDSTDPLLLAMLTWHEDITYALCSYPDELCQQHTTPGAAAAAAAGAAAAATDGAAIEGNAEAGNAEAGNTEEAGVASKAGGEAGHQGSIPAAVKAAVLAELSSNGYPKAFQALVSEGQGLVQQARGKFGERAEGESPGEGEGAGEGERGGKLLGEGEWRGEMALPLLDMFGTVHRLKGKVAEWVGGCERVAETGKGSGEASGETSGEASGEASEGAGAGAGEGEAVGEGERAWEQLEEEVAVAAMAALQAGRDDIMAEIRAVAAECTQLQAVAGGFKQAATLRRQYSKGGGKPAGAKSGKAGGAVSAGADPLTVFVVDRIRQFSSWDTKHALLGAHSITSFPSSASSSKRTSLKRLTSTPAKAALVAAAVADSGDGADVGKKKEEEKPKKRSGFFGFGSKEKGDGGGGKGAKVPVQEILRGLYLFNNAAYIQSLFPDLRMSKEFRQLADTQMNRFLDVLLKDVSDDVVHRSTTTNISAAEFQKRLDAFNVAFEELCFNMRRFHVHDSVARTQIRGVCHERILSTYKEFLMPFREDLVGFPEYRWSVSSAKRVMQNFFI